MNTMGLVRKVFRRDLLRVIAVRLSHRYRKNASYDRDTVAVIARVFNEHSNGVDVGAHHGTILQHMVRVAPHGHHFAFEAVPEFASRLRTNFPDVDVHEVALANRIGRAEFLFIENDPGYSGLQRRIYDRADPMIRPIPVMVTTLDASLPRDIPIAFIKIDVEGGEYDVMRGAEQTIRRWRPVIVFEAGQGSTGQYGVAADDVYVLMDGFSYELSTMRRWLAGGPVYSRETFRQNWNRKPGEPGDYYFIALPR